MLLDNYVFESFKTRGCLAAFSRGKLDLGFKDNPDLRKNRSLFLEGLGIAPERLVCGQQVHGNRIFLAQAKDAGKGAFEYETAASGYDGLISAGRNLPLAVFSADCLSVFMLDTVKQVAAILHAGWKGTKDKIVLAALDIFKGKFNSRPRDIICGFGPSIRACCYEVGLEFHDYFSKGLVKRKGRVFLDLANTNREQLIASGLPQENISDCGICTSCHNKEFFSYRKDGQGAGRMMSVIMLE